MTELELLNELKRLAAIMPNAVAGLTRGDQQAHVAELMRRYSWLSALEWGEVVNWLLDHHNTRSLPTLAEYGKAVSAVRNRGGIQEKAKCSRCGGSGFIPQSAYRDNGQLVEGVRHCPACGPQNVETKPGLVPSTPITTTSEHVAWCEEAVKRISPAYARKVLADVDAGKCPRFPESVTLLLVQRAADDYVEPPKPEPVHAAVNEIPVGDWPGSDAP